MLLAGAIEGKQCDFFFRFFASAIIHVYPARPRTTYCHYHSSRTNISSHHHRLATTKHHHHRAAQQNWHRHQDLLPALLAGQTIFIDHYIICNQPPCRRRPPPPPSHQHHTTYHTTPSRPAVRAARQLAWPAPTGFKGKARQHITYTTEHHHHTAQQVYGHTHEDHHKK